MMLLNFPMTQLPCSGVGQVGVLTENLVLPLEQDVKRGNFTRVEKYARKLEQITDKKSKQGLEKLAHGRG